MTGHATCACRGQPAATPPDDVSLLMRSFETYAADVRAAEENLRRVADHPTLPVPKGGTLKRHQGGVRATMKIPRIDGVMPEVTVTVYPVSHGGNWCARVAFGSDTSCGPWWHDPYGTHAIEIRTDTTQELAAAVKTVIAETPAKRRASYIQPMFRCGCGATYDTESAAKACLRRNHEPAPTDIGGEESK